MEKTQTGKPKIKDILELAVGSFVGRADSTKTLEILQKTRRDYELSDNSLLNIAIIPAGDNKYEYIVYANLPGAPLPLNYQNQKGLIHFIGGKVLWPVTVPETMKNRQNFEGLFAPTPEQYNEGTSSPNEIEFDGRDTRYIQHTVSLRNKHKYSK